jgi:hypothetical protein
MFIARSPQLSLWCLSLCASRDFGLGRSKTTAGRTARSAAKGEPIACAGKRNYTARKNLSARHYVQNQNFRHKRQVFKERQQQRRLPVLASFCVVA